MLISQSEWKKLFRTTPYVEYNFSMFTESSMELYNEAEIILEDN